MKHLDEHVSDLVDDRLDHDERDRALAHMASCAQCRESVEHERFAKSVLGAASDVEVPDALTDKLLALAEPAGPLPPDDVDTAGVDVAAWGEPAVGPHTRMASHRHHRGSFIDRHRRGVRVAAGGMVGTGAVLMLLATLGAPSTGRDQAPTAVVPPLEQFTVEHARSTGGLPFSEPASFLVPSLSTAAGTAESWTGGIGNPEATVQETAGE